MIELAHAHNPMWPDIASESSLSVRFNQHFQKQPIPKILWSMPFVRKIESFACHSQHQKFQLIYIYLCKCRLWMCCSWIEHFWPNANRRTRRREGKKKKRKQSCVNWVKYSSGIQCPHKIARLNHRCQSTTCGVYVQQQWSRARSLWTRAIHVMWHVYLWKACCFGANTVYVVSLRFRFCFGFHACCIRRECTCLAHQTVYLLHTHKHIHLHTRTHTLLVENTNTRQVHTT